MTDHGEIVRHQVAVAGRVIDARTQQFLTGAIVTITGMPELFRRALALKAVQYGSRWAGMSDRIDRTRARQDGTFYFLDLPDGEYTVTAALPDMGNRYGTVDQKATVTRDASGRMKVAFMELALQPTMVEGKITGAGQRSGIMMVEVRMKGSGERTFSDVKGHYVLAPVEPGSRTVQAFAQGYRPGLQKLELKMAGDAETLNFALTRA